jgi:NADPH:quinone reductase-like Zn-dependent oxidoreductase
LRQQVAIKSAGLIKCPAHLSAPEAATLPCAALTAYNALFTHGELSAGQTVVLLGTGGVSIFALQFAVAHGAQVIITSSSDEKLKRARELGASQTINYVSNPKWGKAVREMTGGQGADLIVEVGGAGTFNESARAVRTGGRIALIGVLAAEERPVNLTSVLMNQIRVQGVFVGNARSFAAMNDFIDEHHIQPVVDARFPFAKAPEAFRALERGAHFGKIVIDEFS